MVFSNAGENFRRGKVTQFFASDENFPRRNIIPDKIFPDEIFHEKVDGSI